MTNIIISKDELLIQGHAGTARYGADLACAAVSAIWYAVKRTLLEEEKLGRLNATIHQEPGYCSVQVNGAWEPYREMSYYGLKEIEEEYPDNVKVRMVDF